MAEAHETGKIMYQNLLDAGCDDATVKRCLLLFKEGKKSEMVPVLSDYRKKLLERVRKGQKQIDCLDYLVYRIKREEKM